HGVFKFLIGLVTLAGEQDRVTRLCFADNLLNGPAAVELHRVGFRAHGAITLLDLPGDFVRVFGARIVAGDESEVGEFGGDPAHFGALARIPVAAAAESHDHPASGDLP